MKKLSLNPKKKIEALLESKVLAKVVPKAVELIKNKGTDKAAQELVGFATTLLEEQAGAVIPKPLKKKTTEIVKKVAVQVVEKAITMAMELIDRRAEAQADAPDAADPPAMAADAEPVVVTEPPAMAADAEPVVVTEPPAMAADAEPVVVTEPPAPVQVEGASGSDQPTTAAEPEPPPAAPAPQPLLPSPPLSPNPLVYLPPPKRRRAFMVAAGVCGFAAVAALVAVTAGADPESDEQAGEPTASTGSVQPVVKSPPVIPGNLPGMSRWDGNSRLRCVGDQKMVINNVSSTVDRPIVAVGNCQLTCMNCRLSGRRGVYVAGNARVTFVRSTITASKWALRASGNARLFVVASKITGKQLSNGNATIVRRNL